MSQNLNKKESQTISDIDEKLTGKSIGDKAKQGIIWTFLLNGARFFFSFIGSIILARILFPEDFGLMAIISIVMQLAHRLTNFGFTMVLVQKKELKGEHLDTVFLTNTILMIILISGIYFIAPFAADFFNNEKIDPILKVIGFNFLLLGLTSVPRAVLRRSMRFKELESSNAISKFLGMLASVIFAIAGFGVWSLVFGPLIGSLFVLIALTYYSRWTPKLKFSLSALKDVFSFGLWVYLGSYINYGINKIDFFIIGKLFNAAQLGFYERAFNLMSMPKKQIAIRIGSVMFSAYSRIQDEDERTVEILKKILLYISIVTYPLMVLMFFTAPALIVILYGDKWIASVLPFQIMCIAGILDTLTLVIEPIITARGLVGNRVRRDLIYLIILTLCVYYGANWGIAGVACGTTIASIFRLGLMLNLLGKELPISLLTFFRAQKSAVVYSCINACVLVNAQYFIKSHFSVYSLQTLTSMTLISFLTFIITHLIIRYKDVDDVIKQLLAESKKLKAIRKVRI